MKTAATCNLLNAYHLTQKAIKTRVNYNIKYESCIIPIMVPIGNHIAKILRYISRTYFYYGE